ncbi:biopolymer transporter Tol [Microbacterium testaceum]|uniref:biopolymer transporter Tol n=1 Tax=Microbacterium testaceum TaxID=2033 RepID=UPI0012442B72|nr:biopolymer transporter Tol [Microbacterium testaceum]
MASAQESTDDERWLVIDGRRWRRTDPELPDDLAARLRSHLGRARSAVRVAKKEGDDAVAAARRRVDLAKHGLGERGPRWWDDEVEARIGRARDAVEELDRLAPPARADGATDVNT